MGGGGVMIALVSNKISHQKYPNFFQLFCRLFYAAILFLLSIRVQIYCFMIFEPSNSWEDLPQSLSRPWGYRGASEVEGPEVEELGGIEQVRLHDLWLVPQIMPPSDVPFSSGVSAQTKLWGSRVTRCRSRWRWESWIVAERSSMFLPSIDRLAEPPTLICDFKVKKFLYFSEMNYWK